MKWTVLIGISLLINLTSTWLIRILNQNIVIAIILFLLSLGISASFIRLLNKKIILVFYSLFIIFSIFFTINNLSRELFVPNALEINTLKVRDNYYKYGVGKFIHNKYTLFLFKYQRNVLTNFSFNQYFFGGLPRYRSYALDFEKYPLFFIIFFIAGIFYLIKENIQNIKWFIYLTIIVFLIIGFADPGISLGLYPIYPIISSVIIFGLYKLILQTKRLVF